MGRPHDLEDLVVGKPTHEPHTRSRGLFQFPSHLPVAQNQKLGIGIRCPNDPEGSYGVIRTLVGCQTGGKNEPKSVALFPDLLRSAASLRNNSDIPHAGSFE